jgi:hypothetical protein
VAGNVNIAPGEEFFKLVRGEARLIHCFLQDPFIYRGPRKDLTDHLSSHIYRHLQKTSFQDYNIDPECVMPQSLSNLEKKCLCEFYVLYLRDKFPYEARSINVFRENGISSPDFAR